MAKKEAKIVNKKEKKNKKDKTSFFKSFKAEIKKVSWPTPKQLVNNTTAVVVIVLILAAMVFVLDSAFGAVNKYGIDKIKEGIVSNNVEENSTEDDVLELNEDEIEATETTTNNQEETVEQPQETTEQ